MAKTLITTTNEPLQRRLKELMESEGLEAIFCRGFEDSVRAFRRTKPEVALIDICLADRSGLDIAKDMITENSETRVLMMSDIDTHAIRNYALRCGARDMLIKPFSDAELIFTLRKYMEDLNAASG